MVKVKLYSQDGNIIREWKAHWHDWIWNYTGIQFAISDGKDGETKIIIKGGIVIIEDLNEESQTGQSSGLNSL
jgi:hypothetical protein